MKKNLTKALLIATLISANAFPAVANELPAENATVITKIIEISEEPGYSSGESGISGGSTVTDTIAETKAQEAAAAEAAAQAAARASSVKSYTDEDLYVLAHVICGEAQGCSDEEQRYVGSVVLNRVAHSGFPNTIKGVVFQKGQYACTWDGNYYREPSASNWANAKWLLENGSVLPHGVVYQAGFKQGKVYLKTAHHYYCYA